MQPHDLLEKGRDLAERIPQSLILLTARIAIANIFWRSGQTKINGFSIREETFFLFREEYKVPLLPPELAAYLATAAELTLPVLLVIGLATRLVGARPVRDDARHPALRHSRRLARTPALVRPARPDRRARPRRDLARPSDLEPHRVMARHGARQGLTFNPHTSRETIMLTRAKFLRLSGVAAAALAVSPAAQAETKSENGVVRVKSAYPFRETIERLKKDIAAKGIRFFGEVDQSQLAADAGIKLNPSTLLMFGNPPLGTQFMTANPDAGLDWPVRLLVIQDDPARSGRSTPTSPGSPRATASSIAPSNSRWRRW